MQILGNREKVAPLIVGICGRSCSGKTAIAEAIASVNRNVLLINMDIFFKNKTSCRFNGFECWEHTECIWFGRLIGAVKALKNGKGTIIRDRSLWTGSYIHMIFIEGVDSINDSSTDWHRDWLDFSRTVLAEAFPPRIYKPDAPDNSEIKEDWLRWVDDVVAEFCMKKRVVGLCADC